MFNENQQKMIATLLQAGKRYTAFASSRYTEFASKNTMHITKYRFAGVENFRCIIVTGLL